jgi:hypothetical protein
LRKDTGRDVSRGAWDLYKDLRTFISTARRDSGKLAKALARDLEQAESDWPEVLLAHERARQARRAAGTSRRPTSEPS